MSKIDSQAKAENIANGKIKAKISNIVYNAISPETSVDGVRWSYRGGMNRRFEERGSHMMARETGMLQWIEEHPGEKPAPRQIAVWMLNSEEYRRFEWEHQPPEEETCL